MKKQIGIFIVLGLVLSIVSTVQATATPQQVYGGGIITNYANNSTLVVLMADESIENVTVNINDIDIYMIASNDSMEENITQWTYSGEAVNQTDFLITIYPQNVTFTLTSIIENSILIENTNENNNTNINDNENTNENVNQNENNVTINFFNEVGEFAIQNQWVLWGIGIAFLAVIIVLGIAQVAKDANARSRKPY